MGITAADRAAMPGHSVQTNLLFYSYEQKNYLDYVGKMLDEQYEKEQEKGAPST